jgi:hypothetical protein
LEAVIQAWLARNPDAHPTGHIPFDEFAREAGKYPLSQGPRRMGSIFGILFLDPLASLDPTRRAIESSKYLAERSMFYLQHMPRILQEQMQLTFLELAQAREVVTVQAQTERLTRTAESFTRAAERLPDQFRDERKATVQQVLDGVSAEREKFFGQLFSEQTTVQQWLKEFRDTFAIGKEMAINVDGAGKALSAFVDRIEAARARPSLGTNTHTFDVREYGAAAKDIGAGAERLDSLLSSMDERGREINRMLGQTRKQGEELTDHVFNRGLVLGSILILQLLFVLIAYRLIVERLTRRSSR